MKHTSKHKTKYFQQSVSVRRFSKGWVSELLDLLREAFNKKNKKCGFFPHLGEGVNLKSTLLKKWGFYSEGGVLGLISTLFEICAHEFCPISSNIG